MHEACQLMQNTAQNLLTIQLAVLDEAGVIVSASGDWPCLVSAVSDCRPWIGCSLPQAFECSGAQESKRIADGIRAVLRGDQPRFEARYAAPVLSESRSIELVAIRPEGQHTGAIVTRTDITPLLRGREQVEQRARQMQRMLSATRLAILVLDSNGRCIRASQTALSLFGASSPAALRHPARPGMSPPRQADGRDSIEKWAEQERQASELGSLVFEWELLRQDGQPLFARVNLTDLGQDGLWHCAIDDISDLKLAQARVEFLAFHDPLTSLPNRHSALEKLRDLLYCQRDPPYPAGVISLELAGFREFNDAYGHTMGDRLLKLVAKELSGQLPPGFLLHRMSGAEYLLLLPGVASHAELSRACEQALELTGQIIRVEEVEFHLQLSAGATLAPLDGSDPEKLLRQASMAREQARRDGTHRFRLYEPRMSVELLHFVQTGQALRLALERHELELYYQPQIDLASGEVVGAEALMRWNSPDHGLVGPGHFIGTAEDTGLIRPMGRWALREACREAAAWRQAGWPGLRVAVNLSAIQFRHEGIRWDVFDALEESGLPPDCLELELTESLLLEEDSAVSVTLARWKEAGIQLTIDDFGTGYSSLSYLKRLAVDKLKIDRSFVSNFLVDNQDRCIVRAMLQMARSLGIQTVAEGIENPSVARQLARLGCDEGQGFLYARPLPAAAFRAWLSGQQIRRRAGSA
jgi:diguanylate cyclase (GGDEF)-like protein